GSAGPFVVANLLTAAHLRLAPRYARYVAPGGALLLGGILDAEAVGLEAALGGHGFAPRASISVEGWTTLELVRAPLHDRACSDPRRPPPLRPGRVHPARE